jgi:hypothetical protein
MFDLARGKTWADRDGSVMNNFSRPGDGMRGAWPSSLLERPRNQDTPDNDAATNPIPKVPRRRSSGVQ